jgi:hypothetical protein
MEPISVFFAKLFSGMGHSTAALIVFGIFCSGVGYANHIETERTINAHSKAVLKIPLIQKDISNIGKTLESIDKHFDDNDVRAEKIASILVSMKMSLTALKHQRGIPDNTDDLGMNGAHVP